MRTKFTRTLNDFIRSYRPDRSRIFARVKRQGFGWKCFRIGRETGKLIQRVRVNEFAMLDRVRMGTRSRTYTATDKTWQVASLRGDIAHVSSPAFAYQSPRKVRNYCRAKPIRRSQIKRLFAARNPPSSSTFLTNLHLSPPLSASWKRKFPCRESRYPSNVFFLKILPPVNIYAILRHEKS